MHPRWFFPINGAWLTVGRQRARYTADFSYITPSGQVVVEDVKGVLTRDAVLRIDLMRCVHGIAVELTGHRKRTRRQCRIPTSANDP